MLYIRMQYLVSLPGQKTLKLYYNDKVYSPEYSSLDTVTIVNKLIKDGRKPDVSILDVGCGSGVIGLSIKAQNPDASVTLCDIDKEAVRISKLNAKRLGLRTEVSIADLMPASGSWDIDIIVANLPTYSLEDMKQELHGPDVAYFSEEPLALYERLFELSKGRTKALVCECQSKYQEPFLELAKKKGWTLILHSAFAFGFVPTPNL